jgi:hypothetical protein
MSLTSPHLISCLLSYFTFFTSLISPHLISFLLQKVAGHLSGEDAIVVTAAVGASQCKYKESDLVYGDGSSPETDFTKVLPSGKSYPPIPGQSMVLSKQFAGK